MSLEGFKEYKRREFCNDVKCPVQVELNELKDKHDDYEVVRQTCRTSCKYTTWQFHHWLIEKGYIILASLKLKNRSDLITAIDKDILKGIDDQVESGKYKSRSQLIEKAVMQLRS